jgi:hypothetical protein
MAWEYGRARDRLAHTAAQSEHLLIKWRIRNDTGPGRLFACPGARAHAPETRMVGTTRRMYMDGTLAVSTKQRPIACAQRTRHWLLNGQCENVGAEAVPVPACNSERRRPPHSQPGPRRGWRARNRTLQRPISGKSISCFRDQLHTFEDRTLQSWPCQHVLREEPA